MRSSRNLVSTPPRAENPPAPPWAASPRARHWQAKLVAQAEDQASARVRCEGLQAFIGAFLQDAGIKVVSSMAHAEPAVRVRFRPVMGQVRTLTDGRSAEG